MADDNKIIPRENGSNGAVELVVPSSRRPVWDLSPREPHLYDYLLILRKHQWLILSFMLAVVSITAIGTFRMQPVYVATSRIEIDRENSNILPFQTTDDYVVDLETYIETQSKILTSETLALQTIRSGILAGQADFSTDPSASDALATGSLANLKAPPELGAFLGSLSVKAPRAGRSSHETNPASVLRCPINPVASSTQRPKNEPTMKTLKWAKLISSMMP